MCGQVSKIMFLSTFSIGEGNGNRLQHSCLENPRDGGAWWAAVYGVAQSRTQLSDFTFTFHFHASEKEMATHSSILAWRIPGMVEPGGLLSLGSHRDGHDWSDLAAAAAAEGIVKINPALSNMLHWANRILLVVRDVYYFHTLVIVLITFSLLYIT